MNVCASDALIAVGGGFGTLSEIALALKARKPVVLLGSWRFEMDDVSPENLANLQAVAKRFVSANSGYLDDVCAKLEEGRGCDMPGTGRA